MTTEKGYEDEVVRWAKKRGWFVRKIEYIGRLGALDRMFVREGMVVFIEMKQPSGGLSHHQVAEWNALREAGANAHVCYTATQAKDVLLAAERLAQYQNASSV